MNNIVLDHQVFINELGTVSIIRHNSTHLGGCIDYILGFFLAEEIFDGFLVGEVVFWIGGENEIGVAF